MKKLMIAVAIVCAAALAQAATVNWGVSNVKADGGAAPTAGWSVMAFYTAVGAGSDAIVSAINNGTAASLAFEEKQLTEFFGTGSVAAHDATAAGITDTVNRDFYFVVFNDGDASKATQYAMVSALNKEYSGMSSKYTAAGNFNGASWQTIAVPEPTSGLLMLLGMAGLALRRKQK